MEFSRINSYKLKITLSEEECAEYEIELDEGEYDSGKIREAIKELLLLDSAPSFDIEGEKLLVQLYPTKDGGAELFITKLSYISERSERAITEADNLKTIGGGHTYFFVKDVITLRALARALIPRKAKLDLYRALTGGYIVALAEDDRWAITLTTEFCDRLPASFVRPSPEWYTLLAEKDGVLYILATGSI